MEEAGWLGLAGFLLLILCWWLQSAYVFAETFILPQLATAAPPFLVSFLGIASGIPGEMNIGPLPAIYSFGIGIPYMLGGLLFGIATLRAGILPPGRSACRRRYVDPRSGAAPARHPAASGDPGGVSSGWDMRFGPNGEREPRTPHLAGEAPSRAEPQPGKVARICMGMSPLPWAP